MTTQPDDRATQKIVIQCDRCYRELKLPKLDHRKLRVTCPTCKHEFYYSHSVWAVSPISKKYLLFGLAGGTVGYALGEFFDRSFAIVAAYGGCLGAALGMADGFLRKNRPRLIYGLKTGAILGLISGVVSGSFAQLVFSAMLQPQTLRQPPPIGNLIFARALAWCVFGALVGAAYGVKENTRGDVKFGLVGGAIAGALGGMLFDPLALLIPSSDGTVSRFVGFTILGMAISFSVNRFREIALAGGRPEMYRQLTAMLPVNPRLSLPSPRRD